MDKVSSSPTTRPMWRGATTVIRRLILTSVRWRPQMPTDYFLLNIQQKPPAATHQRLLQNVHIFIGHGCKGWPSIADTWTCLPQPVNCNIFRCMLLRKCRPEVNSVRISDATIKPISFHYYYHSPVLSGGHLEQPLGWTRTTTATTHEGEPSTF